MDDGSKVGYDKLLIATGGRARKPAQEGIDLGNIFLLRTADDQTKIKAAAKDAKKIIVVGGGFISSEVTANLKKSFPNKEVIMLVDFVVPMERVFGYDIGAMFLHEHEKNGVKVFLNRNIFHLKYNGDKNGNVKSVVLDNGYEVEGDLVVVGAGIIPNTELAKDGGLELKMGGIRTNPFMQTSDSDIFAAGDVATFPCWYTG